MKMLAPIGRDEQGSDSLVGLWVLELEVAGREPELGVALHHSAPSRPPDAAQLMQSSLPKLRAEVRSSEKVRPPQRTPLLESDHTI